MKKEAERLLDGLPDFASAVGIGTISLLPASFLMPLVADWKREHPLQIPISDPEINKVIHSILLLFLVYGLGISLASIGNGLRKLTDKRYLGRVNFIVNDDSERLYQLWLDAERRAGLWAGMSIAVVTAAILAGVFLAVGEGRPAYLLLSLFGAFAGFFSIRTVKSAFVEVDFVINSRLSVSTE